MRKCLQVNSGIVKTSFLNTSANMPHKLQAINMITEKHLQTFLSMINHSNMNFFKTCLTGTITLKAVILVTT